MRLAAWCVGVVLAAFAVGARAQEGGDEKCAPDPQEEAQRLGDEISQLFADGKYAEAAEKCRAQAALVPKSPDPPYNLACALARLGKKDEAMSALAKSVELGFEAAAHLEADPDLESLHGEKGWAELVAKVKANEEKAAAGTYDPGVDVPDVKSVERAPEGGLKYRLLTPADADPKKPLRLLVWLHPSGGSMNGAICGLSTHWTRDGFAVLLPVQKRWMGWSDDDAKKLVDKTLPDAATVPGVDAKRPVLAGFSAGGQMALSLWREDPARWGGLFVDAAYPIDMEKYQQTRSPEPLALPAGDGAKSVPIFALVGDQDGGHRIWKQVEEPWRKAGVPLTVDYVEGGRHAWLLDGARQKALDEWLVALAAGKLPGKAEEPAPAK